MVKNGDLLTEVMRLNRVSRRVSPCPRRGRATGTAQRVPWQVGDWAVPHEGARLVPVRLHNPGLESGGSADSGALSRTSKEPQPGQSLLRRGNEAQSRSPRSHPHPPTSPRLRSAQEGCRGCWSQRSDRDLVGRKVDANLTGSRCRLLRTGSRCRSKTQALTPGPGRGSIASLPGRVVARDTSRAPGCSPVEGMLAGIHRPTDRGGS